MTRNRPTRQFLLTLEPLPHIEPVQALKAALKALRRRFGLRCVAVTAAPRPGKRKINRPDRLKGMGVDTCIHARQRVE